MLKSTEKKGHISKDNQQLSISQKHFSGPVPSPDDLIRYNEIIPNGAERFMAMAEKEQEYRHNVKISLLKEDQKLSQQEFLMKKIGLFCGFIIGILIILLCFYAFYRNFPEQGIKIGTWSLIGVVGLFITGKVISHKNNSEEQKTT